MLKIFQYLKEHGLAKRMIVAAKFRIITNGTWQKELKKWGLGFTWTVLNGPKKDLEYDKDYDIYFINYEGFEWLAKKIEKKPKFDIFCFDESSKIKRTNTKRFKALKRIIAKVDRRYILTGSVRPEGYEDLFGQIYALDYGYRLGKFITAFRNNYFYPSGYGGYTWKLQKGADKEIIDKISDCVVYFGEEELEDMPELNIVPRYIELPDKIMSLYKEMEKEFIIELDDKKITSVSAAALSQKCRQIASGFIYDKHKKATILHDGKIEEVKEIIEEAQGSPVLIGYEYEQDLATILEHFPNAPYIGKGVSGKRGSELEDEWNRGNLPYLFGQTSSIAHGLNLQDAGHIACLYSLTWPLEDWDQFVRRIRRQGQKSKYVNYIHIIARGTIEEDMFSAVQNKELDQSKFNKQVAKLTKERYYG